MTIETTETKVHWNYFLALEADVAEVARYIEFDKKNFRVFSIELAHLLLAAASEVDVVTKLLCAHLDPNAHLENIKDYRQVVLACRPEICKCSVSVLRYGLTLRPWSSWPERVSPFWWSSYNQVKHHRDTSFSEANLKNCLNSVAALLVVVFYYYAIKGGHDLTSEQGRKRATAQLAPSSVLFRLPIAWYHDPVYV